MGSLGAWGGGRLLPGTAGTLLGWVARDRPLLGAGKKHPPAPRLAQPPWVGMGSGEEPWGCCASGWGRPRAVDTGGDAVGSRCRGQTHLPGQGEPAGGCFGIPGRTRRPCQLKSEVSAQIEPRSATCSSSPAPLCAPTSGWGQPSRHPKSSCLLPPRGKGKRVGMLSAGAGVCTPVRHGVACEVLPEWLGTLLGLRLSVSWVCLALWCCFGF